MKLNEFFATHPVFTTEELTAFLGQRGSHNLWTRKALLAHHQKQGRLLRVRRGLYVVVPPGMAPQTCPVDPYLLAARMTTDAVLAYHTALEFHGTAYSVFEQFQYLTARAARPVTFRAYRFHGVSFPKQLSAQGQAYWGVDTAERTGVSVRVTSLERTLVDVLDRPSLAGTWEEIWRSLESIAYLDLDQVITYTLLLGNATTAAKVGFFLEQHREAFMVEEAHLQPLLQHRPRMPHYVERRGRRSGQLVPTWNVIVPREVGERSWQDVL